MRDPILELLTGGDHPFAFGLVMLGLICLITGRWHEGLGPALTMTPTDRAWWSTYGISYGLALAGIALCAAGFFIASP